MTVEYTPSGVCAHGITVSAENGVITDAEIMGGCSGNLQGVCRLIRGMPVTEAITQLRGIRCGPKSTSCPDQLSLAMEKLLETEK
jgi:uncharacterized protein (TIGR03905 family)